ncbi:uncharacterized protein TNCV_5113871 [Trichonephila clavipes]|nr:uncharacterized protein TNCV_5113871 [Trichonephila clavipes]
MVNVDQVRIYRHRKCHEMEIRTGSSDSNSSRQESSSFYRVQRRSNESQYGRKKGSDVKSELEEKGISFKKNQGERHTTKTNKRGPLIRSTPSSWSEASKRIKRNKNQKIGYKRSRESGSGGPERKIQKGSDHRVPKRALSSNYTTNSNLPKFRKMRRNSSEQHREDQFEPGKAREGTTTPTSKSEQDQTTGIPDEEVINNGRTKKGRERILAGSISLEVLVGDTNYKS